ncbi:MAG: hypothetical protein ACE5H1_01560 [Thermodesulfobacteriota bacterium]
MTKKIEIGWDISHQEFTINDHYYFSILKSKLLDEGALVSEVRLFKDIIKYDVLILNYPEKPFTKSDTKLVNKFLDKGNKVIACGYYDNEDMIADNINSISTHFGLSLKEDGVRDKLNNFKGDDLLIVTSKILSYDSNIKKVLLPCCSSITINGSSAAEFVLTEGSLIAKSKNKTILAAQSCVGNGKFILIGTCVFWDNFAINRFSNMRFALNLLLDP